MADTCITSPVLYSIFKPIVTCPECGAVDSHVYVDHTVRELGGAATVDFKCQTPN
jgi:hypothetical protein